MSRKAQSMWSDGTQGAARGASSSAGFNGFSILRRGGGSFVGHQ